MKDEKKIILLLSNVNLSDSDVNSLEKLLNNHIDWSEVLGYLLFHRLMGVAWSNLNKYIDNKQTYTYKRLYGIIEQCYLMQKIKITEQLKYEKEALELLTNENINFALMKGSILSQYAYDDLGVRNYSDTDFLIRRDQISKTIKVLGDNGYVQGSINKKTKEIIHLERKEIALWTLVSHETYPLIRKTSGCNSIYYHIMDLQFSIDLMSKNRTDTFVEDILENIQLVNVYDSLVPTFSWEDQLIFLCIHFYKEAINLNEVMKYKDLSLYKICDINAFVNSCKFNLCWKHFVNRVNHFGCQKAVYYSFFYTRYVYGNFTIPEYVFKSIEPIDTSYIHNIYHYDNSIAVHTWKDDILERIFDIGRPSAIKDLWSDVTKENI